MKNVLFIMLFLFATQVVAQDKNFIRENTPYSFEESTTELKYQLKYHQMTIFSEINHSAEAEKVALELPKMMVFIVGNPKVGTTLMQENQDIALHLPLKILVREKNNGQTEIVYQKIAPLAVKYGLKKTLPTAQKIDNLMKNIIKDAITEIIECL